MEYQCPHKNEKGDGEESKGRNGSERPCNDPNKAGYPPQEEIGCNHIDNEKGKGNGQVGEKQEYHPPKKQANDQPPCHRLRSLPHIEKTAPGHPEELDGKEDAAYG